MVILNEVGRCKEVMSHFKVLNPPLDPRLRQMKSVCTLTRYFFNIFSIFTSHLRLVSQIHASRHIFEVITRKTWREEIKLRWEDDIKMILKKQDVRMWTGFNSLRTRTNSGFSWTL
jgi:hypothetical protein